MARKIRVSALPSTKPPKIAGVSGGGGRGRAGAQGPAGPQGPPFPNPQNVLTVGISGCDYDTIAEAMAEASDGDLITVYVGTYPEKITLKSGVSLKGMGDVVVDASAIGAGFPALDATDTTGCVVEGIHFKAKAVTAQSQPETVVNVSGSTGLVVKNCTLEGASYCFCGSSTGFLAKNNILKSPNPSFVTGTGFIMDSNVCDYDGLVYNCHSLADMTGTCTDFIVSNNTGRLKALECNPGGGPVYGTAFGAANNCRVFNNSVEMITDRTAPKGVILQQEAGTLTRMNYAEYNTWHFKCSGVDPVLSYVYIWRQAQNVELNDVRLYQNTTIFECTNTPLYTMNLWCDGAAGDEDGGLANIPPYINHLHGQAIHRSTERRRTND